MTGGGERGAGPKTVVSYPGVMPAALQVARAFAEAGLLERYETTVAYCADHPVDRVLREGALRLFGAGFEAQLSRRAARGLPAARVRRSPSWELARVAAARLGAGEVVVDRVWERMVERFDAGVARRLVPEIDLVYGYEHACLATFERARALGAARAFDLAAPHHTFTERVLVEQYDAFPELRMAYRRATEQLDAQRNERKQAELELASLVIANSRFTARTLIETGYPEARVRVVPLGAPQVDGRWRMRPRPSSVRFLFAGSAGPRKGAHLLIEAWRRLGARRGAELVIAGQWLLPARLRATLPAGVRVLGSIPQQHLFEQYLDASALVFPSVCDGFGMVVTEALAHGLPVITTRNVGAADLLEDGVSGFVLPPGDVEALSERLAWCIDHPDALHAMRERAEEVAARRQWSDYRRQLLEVARQHHRGASGTEAPR